MKTIRQTVQIEAGPLEVYEALMDSRTHTRVTGSRARISPTVGGRFTAYDGYAEGVNVQLIPGRKIVQTWRAADWPKGHYSTATFALARVPGGTRLTFTQTGVPDGDVEEIKRGWIEFYWEPLQAMLARPSRRRGAASRAKGASASSRRRGSAASAAPRRGSRRRARR